MNDFRKEMIYRHRKKKRALGLVVIVVGVLLLLKQTDVFIPDWLFSWPMIFIVIGVYKIVSERYFSSIGLVFLVMGSVFLLRDNFNLPDEVTRFFWPAFIILMGIIIILRPRSRRCMYRDNWRHHYIHGKREMGNTPPENNPQSGPAGTADVLDTVAIFCGIKRTIFSKNFKGGDTTNIFGGTEINLMQADFNGKITLDATVMFGGLKLIVPPEWDVRTDLTNIFGGFDDKRYHAGAEINAQKVLMIDGTILFGGIEITSY